MPCRGRARSKRWYAWCGMSGRLLVADDRDWPDVREGFAAERTTGDRPRDLVIVHFRDGDFLAADFAVGEDRAAEDEPAVAVRRPCAFGEAAVRFEHPRADLFLFGVPADDFSSFAGLVAFRTGDAEGAGEETAGGRPFHGALHAVRLGGLPGTGEPCEVLKECGGGRGAFVVQFCEFRNSPFSVALHMNRGEFIHGRGPIRIRDGRFSADAENIVGDPARGFDSEGNRAALAVCEHGFEQDLDRGATARLDAFIADPFGVYSEECGDRCGVALVVGISTNSMYAIVELSPKRFLVLIIRE